jgi:hypothetical protein
MSGMDPTPSPAGEQLDLEHAYDDMVDAELAAMIDEHIEAAGLDRDLEEQSDGEA